MELSQKRFSNRTKFEFGEDMLKYTYASKGGSETFAIEYGLIPTETGALEERNEWFRNVGFLWTLLGGYLAVARYVETGELSAPLWLVLGVLCFAIYWWGKTSYTTIATKKGLIAVLTGAHHDEIMGEIAQRRKDQLLKLCGEVNLDNDPVDELNKYKWLFDYEVISELQYQEFVQEIALHHGLEIVAGDDLDDLLHN